MTVNNLATYFGKRKRTGSASSAEPLENDTDPKLEKDTEGLSDCDNQDICSSLTRTVTISSNDTSSVEDDLDRKPAGVIKCDTEISAANTFLMLGSDIMVNIVSFLEPRETLTLLTVPLCKEWRLSYTADQELWRTVCCTEPFAADLSTYGAAIEASASLSNAPDDEEDDEEDNSFCSLEDYKDAFEKKNVLVGEYRLIYTSFVRCMNYLDQVQNNDDGFGVGVNNSWAKESDESNSGNKFPTFGVTKSLKKFLSKSKERGILKSVIGNGTTDDIPSAPVGVSTDGHQIHKGTFSKAENKKQDDDQKPRYGNSMITRRLWGPTTAGVPSHLNLPKSCAIYSIVNWMVAHPNVRGVQTMCIKALPPLLEDESQRLIGRRVGLVEVILCAMLRFPDSVELHIAVFHAIVLLARPLGGREGMLFNNSMAENTQNIGLTSPVELSDPMSLAARCGGHPSLDGKKTKSSFTRNGSSRSDTNEEENKQTGISILVESMGRFADSEKLQSMACWALVNVALVPIQKNLLMKIGGVEAILSAMETHATSFDVQFRALFALINLAVPCRESDFMFDPNIDARDATFQENVVLDELRERIARLSVAAMKNFWSSESILNRGCLVIHNLSQSPKFIRMLLHTPDCCQLLRYCLENHASDRVLRRSVASTLQRMQFFLEQHPEERDPFAISYQPNADSSVPVW